MKDFFVYLLQCSDGSFYTGHTDDLEKRLYEHQMNYYECYTSTRLPVSLVFYMTFCSRSEALAAERQIKGWSRIKKQALIEGNFNKICTLSRARRPKK
jgi:predicted GIY-YIG superfamily endonuclease